MTIEATPVLVAPALVEDQPMTGSAEGPRPAARIKPLHLFDKMAERAAVWVKDMMDELGTDDPRAALHALRAGLQALRDRLSVDEAAQLSAQLPLVIRGFFFENWDPSRTPVRARHPADFLALVREKYGAHSHVSAGDLVAALFRVLGRHVSAGEISDIMMTFPEPLLAVVDPRAAEHRTSER